MFTKQTCEIDILPNELIEEVLRHATWEPYGIDPSDMVYQSLQSSRYREITRRFRSSLVTRRFLVRVCKRWHRLALPYLYEWILAVRFKSLKGIVEAVERSLSNGSTTSVGEFARRLDINFRKTGTETKEQKEQEGMLILRLLRALPNLRVLTVGTCYQKNWFSSPFSHSYCPKLESLNWMSERDVSDPDVWVNFVKSHPNLIAVHPCATNFSSFEATTQDQPPHSLRALTTSFASAVHIDTFTSLERLNLNLYNLYFAWDHFFEYQGLGSLSSIKTLQLNFPMRNRTDDLGYSFNGLQRLFLLLPNLRRIDLVLPVWPQVWSGAILPATVSMLGFRVCSGKPSRQLVKRLLHSLKLVVRPASPALKVQFMDEETMQGVCTHERYVVRNVKAREVLEAWLDPDGNEYRLRIQ